MDYKDLTDEQRARVAACNSPEELLAYAKAEGYELTDKDLEHVSGGWGDDSPRCPECGSKCIPSSANPSKYVCQGCGYVL